MILALPPDALAIVVLFMLIMIGSLISAFGHSSVSDRVRGAAVVLICLAAVGLVILASRL